MTPDKKYSDRKDNSIRPSWAENEQYIDTTHKEIFNKTKDIPGWQMEEDTYKLYEMAYFAGNVILEIGTFGGRSVVVELNAALKGFSKPQLFGIEVDISGIKRTYDTLKQHELENYALLYHGTLQEFIKDFTISPTMCFVDGDHLYDGVKKDLDSLSEILSPGIPVLIHDYLNPENDTGDYGVRKAALEWEAEGYASFYGVFGCSALFVTTDKCVRRQVNLSAEEFARCRKNLHETYGLESTKKSHALSEIIVEKLKKSCRPYQRIYRLGSFILHNLRTIRSKFELKAKKEIMVLPKDENYADHKGNDNKPEWLEAYPCESGFALISSPTKYSHDEMEYDKQYNVDSEEMGVGSGLVLLLRKVNANFEGTALEIGCGTGILSLGLVMSKTYPAVVLTDPSPDFLKITYQKMIRASADTSNVHLAVLKAEDIDRLPRNEFSLIVLRSVLHHVLDVTKFINDASLSLRPGGVLVFQEPCMEGYVLMGAMAQFIPLAIKQAGVKLNEDHKRKIQSFVHTMQFYARNDLDKSSAEDKHLFRVDEIMKICSTARLTAEFLPNIAYEQYLLPFEEWKGQTLFYNFFRDYLKYCMSFDEKLIDLINKHFRKYCTFIDDLSVASNSPYLHGIFVCRKQ